MGRFTNNSRAVTEDHSTDARRQWLRLRVPSSDASGFIHIGQPGTDSMGYRGITLSTSANFMVNAVSGSLFQSGGPTQFQSVGDWTQLSSSHMHAYAHGNMNLGAKGGIVIASIGTTTADLTAVADHSGDASGDLPGLTTHPHFAIDRNKIYDDFQNTKNWATLVGGIIAGVKTLLGSSFDGSALAKFTTVVNGVTQLITVASNSVSVGRGAGTLDHSQSDEEKQGTGSKDHDATAGTSSGLADADPLDTSGKASLANQDIGYGAGYAAWAGTMGTSGSQSVEQAARQVHRKPGEDEDTYQARLTTMREASKTDRDAATAKLNTATVERDALKADVARLEAERDRHAVGTPERTQAEQDLAAKKTQLDAKETEVTNAQTESDTAQSRLQAVDTAERTQAETRLTNARSAQTSAQSDLDVAKNNQSAAQRSLDEAIAARTTAEGELSAAKAQQTALANDPRSRPNHPEHAAWQAEKNTVDGQVTAKETAFNQRDSDVTTRTTARDARTDEVNTKQEALDAKTSVVEHEETLQANAGRTTADVAGAQQSVTDAKAAHVQAQTDLEQARTSGASAQEIADKETAVTNAGKDVESAEKNLANEQALAGHLEDQKAEAWKGRLNTAGEALGALAAVAGAAAATAGLASAITAVKKNAPPGVATISTDDIFVGTSTAYTAMANSGFTFIAPNISGFNVLAGGGFQVQSGLQSSIFALQGASMEGGINAEVVAGGSVNLHSRMKDISVVGKEVKIGGALEDVPNLVKGKVNPFAQMPTQEVTIKTLAVGQISIIQGPTNKIEMTPAKTTISAFGNTIELSAAGITIKAATALNLEAPTVNIKGTAKVSIQAPDVEAQATAKFAAQGGASSLNITPANISGTSGANSLTVGGGVAALA